MQSCAQLGNMVFYGSDFVRWIPQECRNLRRRLLYLVSVTNNRVIIRTICCLLSS